MVAAMVPDHDVCIRDMRLDNNLDAALRRFRPEKVAVTALTAEVYAAQHVLQQVKSFSSEILTVVGGHHATLVPKDFFLPQVDAVAVGEAELMFRELVEAVADRRGLHGVPHIIWRNHDGTFIRNALAENRVSLDDLPMPRRDLTESYRNEYFFLFDQPDTSVATSRGCPFRCKFCSLHRFHRGAINQMTPQRVLSEILTVSSDHITFVDDNFLMSHKPEDTIADLAKSAGVRKRFSMECRTDSIVKRPELVEKWVDIGLYAVLLGLEGGCDRTLKKSTNPAALRPTIGPSGFSKTMV
jgi:radical SAM superfamily enzyme YgiQ (UPF0313 family)